MPAAVEICMERGFRYWCVCLLAVCFICSCLHAADSGVPGASRSEEQSGGASQAALFSSTPAPKNYLSLRDQNNLHTCPAINWCHPVYCQLCLTPAALPHCPLPVPLSLTANSSSAKVRSLVPPPPCCSALPPGPAKPAPPAPLPLAVDPRSSPPTAPPLPASAAADSTITPAQSPVAEVAAVRGWLGVSWQEAYKA